MLVVVSMSYLGMSGYCQGGVCAFGAAFSFSDSESGDASGDSTLSFDPSGMDGGYSAVLYDNTSGLPTSEANAIAQTAEGFIWIASYSGLIRYDGETFERMDSSTGVASVISLFVDSQQRLWAGTNDSGAAVMIDGEFKMYNKDDGLKSLSVRSIVEDQDGNVYLGTTRGIVMVDENLKAHALDLPAVNEEFIRELKLGNDGVIYGVTMSGAVFTMENQQVTSFCDPDTLHFEDAHAIEPDPNNPGYAYVGTMDARVFYGRLRNGFTYLDSYYTKGYECINEIEVIDDMVWLCTDMGQCYIQNDELKTIADVPMTTSFEDIMVDYLGDLWFTSTSQGIMKVVPNQFEDVFSRYGLEDEVIETTCEYNGMILAGSKNSGLLAFEGDERIESIPVKKFINSKGTYNINKNLISILKNVRIRSLIEDSAGRLWISTFDDMALLRYYDGTLREFNEDDGLPSTRIRTVYECDDGSFIVCCTGGLAVIKDNVVTGVYGKDAGIENEEILTAIQAANGDIVLGTDGGGIYVISGEEISHIGVDEGLSSDVVMRVKNSSYEDIIWVVTSNSIGYLTSDYEIHNLETFPYSNNFDLYENSKGELWVLSSNGIYVTAIDELMKDKGISPLFYGIDNGLPCITTSNSYSELTDDGLLYIAGTTGIAMVNIDSEFEDVGNIRVAVPFIEVDGEYVYPNEDGDLIIPDDAQKVTVYSYVYNYSLMNPEVTFWLDGFEETRTTVKRSEMVPIDYTNLKGGDYYFTMNVQDPHATSTKKVIVPIVKKYNITELWWVQALMVVVFLMLVWIAVNVYIRIRTNRFRKKEQEQKTLIREIVEAFAKVIDMKDKYTNGHSNRVAEYTAMLTKELGYDEDTVDRYYNIALLHDIGKVGIPPEVLNKPGKLTDHEFNIIKSHSALGYEALKDISIMPELAIGAGAHHERVDGKGYPKGLSGDEIPRVAQIIAVADTFDAMYSDRPYRKRMNFEKVISIMKEASGTQLTPDVVDAFLRLVEKGEFRDPDDYGGGTFDDIDNIHKRFEST
ncbi:MAG: HD domain-containing protein [Eubacterium sp.]|nr:HD domain-containing protein [Eubacterium sp.]